MGQWAYLEHSCGFDTVASDLILYRGRSAEDGVRTESCVKCQWSGSKTGMLCKSETAHSYLHVPSSRGDWREVYK